MTALVAAVVLQSAVLATGAQPYKQAYAAAMENRQPLVVLVGAEWCPGCVTMKRSTMPQLLKAGKLAGVQYTEVNVDHEGALARRMMRGGSIPQLIVFVPTATGWKRTQVIGAQSPQRIEALVAAAERLAAEAAAVAQRETEAAEVARD